MNGLRHLRSRPRALAVVVIALVAVHIVFLHLFWDTGLPPGTLSGAVLSGVALVVIAKHLGLFGTLLGSLYARLRRRSRG